jgi:hypothetical protein
MSTKGPKAGSSALSRYAPATRIVHMVAFSCSADVGTSPRGGGIWTFCPLCHLSASDLRPSTYTITIRTGPTRCRGKRLLKYVDTMQSDNMQSDTTHAGITQSDTTHTRPMRQDIGDTSLSHAQGVVGHVAGSVYFGDGPEASESEFHTWHLANEGRVVEYGLTKSRQITRSMPLSALLDGPKHRPR